MYYTKEVIGSARNSREAVEVLLWWAKLIRAHGETAALIELPVPHGAGCSAVAIILLGRWRGETQQWSLQQEKKKNETHQNLFTGQRCNTSQERPLTLLSMCQALSSHVQIKSSYSEELSQSQKCAKSLSGCPIKQPACQERSGKVCSVKNPFLR